MGKDIKKNLDAIIKNITREEISSLLELEINGPPSLSLLVANTYIQDCSFQKGDDVQIIVKAFEIRPFKKKA